MERREMDRTSSFSRKNIKEMREIDNCQQSQKMGLWEAFLWCCTKNQRRNTEIVGGKH